MQMVNFKRLMMAVAVGFALAVSFNAPAQKQQDRTPPKEPRVVVQRPKEDNQQRNSKRNDNKDNNQNRGGKKP